MTERITETTVTFRHPFMLKDFDSPQPEGTYLLTVEEQEISGLSFLAFGRTRTILSIPAIGASGSKQESYAVDPSELVAVLEADRAR